MRSVVLRGGHQTGAVVLREGHLCALAKLLGVWGRGPGRRGGLLDQLARGKEQPAREAWRGGNNSINDNNNKK